MVRLDPSSGAVQVLDDSGELLWSGKPSGRDASLVLPVPGSRDAIVLLTPDAQLKGRFGNLLRIIPGRISILANRTPV
jgi:hypothetical protein